jgi:multidrug/hemolysin transport system permease protein
MVFFLGDLYNSDLLDALKMVPGRGSEADAELIRQLSFLWTSAGILTINAATITHAFYSNMIKDRTGNRLNSLLVMPVKRPVFVLGYISGAWLAGIIMSIITLAVTEAIGVFKGMEVLPFETHVQLILLIMLNNFVFSTIMFLMATIIKSQSAWGGIGIVLGTLAGFLGGIYFPLGSMNDTMQNVVKCFPFIYGTSLFRKVMLHPLENTLFSGTPEIIRQEVDKTMGMDLFLGNSQLSQQGKVGILILVGLVFIVLSTVCLSISKKKDR